MKFFDKQKTAQGIYGEATLGKRPWWARPFAHSATPSVMGYLATALLLYSVWYGLSEVNARNFEPPPSAHADQGNVPAITRPDSTAADEKQLTAVGFQKAVLIIFWVLMPPIWFWLEYFGLWRYEEEGTKQCLEELKAGQELAAKIWLAAVTALGILYFGKDIKGGG